MAMSKPAKHLYQFGPSSVDVAERVLLRDGRPVALPPKAFELLLVLVEHRGHPLEKDELMRRCGRIPSWKRPTWPITSRRCVRRWRHASGSRTSRRRRGYRFVAEAPLA